MKHAKLLSLLFLILSSALFAAVPQVRENYPNSTAVKVSRVIDGDTIKVTHDGIEETVRLIGVDTPETVHPQKPVEQFGREASAMTKKLLEGKSVWLITDDGSLKTDKYGRILAYVYRSDDGLLINHEIIRLGYGHAYTNYPFGKMEDFRAAERDARQTQQGLWAAPAQATPTPTPKPQTTITRTPSSSYRTNQLPVIRKPVRPDIPNNNPQKTVHVQGYYRKDGTYVRGHNRRPPSR